MITTRAKQSINLPKSNRTFFNRWLFFSFSAPTLLLVTVALSSHITEIPIGNFTRDPSAVSEANPFVGIVSNIGLLIWASTIAICFFSASFASRFDRSRETTYFFLYAGCFTALLMFDDMLMFHEHIFRYYFYIPEKVTLATYGAALFYFLYRFRNLIISSGATLLAISIGFFGLSVSIDLIAPPSNYQYLFEDGFKLLGIVSWLLFFVATAQTYFLRQLHTITS